MYKNSISFAIVLILTVFHSININAQNSIITATTTYQNFNSLGIASNSSLPPGWRISIQGGGSTATYANSAVGMSDHAANSGSPVAGGVYNWGNSGGVDRSAGFLGNSYGSSNSVIGKFTNTTGGVVTTVTISFDIERYVTNTSGFSLSFFYSTDDVNYLPLSSGDIATGVFAAGAVVYDFTPGQTVSRTVHISSLNIADGSNIYFKWLFNTGNSNSQGLGLDEVVVSAGSTTIAASMTSTISTDVSPIGQANPGDVISYTTTITNNGGNTARGVVLTQPAPANTTLINGSVKSSALANDDHYSTSYNTVLTGENVLANDFGLPSITVLSYGKTSAGGLTTVAGGNGTTDNGGTIVIGATGVMTYTPPINFSGTDQFKYVASTGVGLPDNDGIVTINVGTDISLSTVSSNPNCSGSASGMITVTASGGSGSLSYSKDNGTTFQSSNIFNGLVPGSYTIVVRDAYNYSKSTVVSLSDPAPINILTATAANLCSGGSTASLTVTASGGAGNFEYSNNNGSSFQAGNTFTGLTAGTYTIVVKDGNGCTNTTTTVLTDPAAISLDKSIANNLCNGGSAGTITVTASGGTGTLEFSNNSGSSYQLSNMFSGLTAGTYTIVVKDVNGCTGTTTAILTDPPLLVVNGSIGTVIYNTAIAPVNFTASGGTGAVTWSGTGLPTGLTINSGSGQLSGTPGGTGTFTVTVSATDVNGCTASKTVYVNVAPNLSNDSYSGVVGNTQMVADIYSTPSTPYTTNATNILNNDASDAPIIVSAVTASPTTAGGVITIASNGKFIYTPPTGVTGADSYTYTASSNGVSTTATISFTISNMVWYVNNTYAGGSGTANGSSSRPFTDVGTAAGTSIAGQTIYVHAGSGSTTGNAVLKASQTLRGSGSALSIGSLSLPAGTKPTLSGTVSLANAVTVDGFDMSTGASAALTSNGATSVIVSIGNINTSGAVNAAVFTSTTGSVTISGGTQTNSTGAAISVSGGSVNLTYSGNISQASNAAMVNVTGGHNGTLTFQTGVLSATNGTGVQFDNADGSYNFTGSMTMNGGDAGIDILNGSAGSFNFSSAVSITNPINELIKINGSSANVTYSGSFSKNNNTSGIVITNETGGTISINGTGTKSINSGSATSISVVNSTGSTINVSGNNLLLTTTSGTGLAATGGGILNITGTGNMITTTTGTAVNISSPTNIGADGVTFKSITVNNGGSNSSVNGIILVGTTGAFTVSGDGNTTSGLYNRNGSGGTINRTTGHSVLLSNASNVTLRQMNISNTALNFDAINSSGSSSLVFSAMLLQNLGGNGWKGTNLGGGNSFDNNCKVENWQTINAVGVYIDNTNTNFTSFNLRNSLFTNSATGADAFLFDANGATSGLINVVSNEFTLIDQDAVQINNDGSGNITGIVQKNNFHDADATDGDGNNTLYMAASGSGTLNFTIGGPTVAEGNTFNNLGRLACLCGVVQVNGVSTNQIGTRIVGTVENNVISNSTGRRGIDFGMEANGGSHGGHDITVRNNSISNTQNQGINFLMTSVNGGDQIGNRFKIINNTLTNVGLAGNVDSGSGVEIETNSGSAGGNFGSDILITGNTVSNNNSSAAGSTLEIVNRSLFAGDASTMNITIWGNSLTNANAAGEVMEVLGSGTAGTGTICLDLNGANTPSNINTFNGGSVRLTNNYGTYNISGMSAGTQSPSNVQTFVTARNSFLNGASVVAGGLVGTFTGTLLPCQQP